MDVCESPGESNEDLLANVNESQDNLLGQLTLSNGLNGLSAASAILSTKHPRNNFKFETNAATRKRQQTRLIKKIKLLTDELASRCGQQICVLYSTHSKQTDFKVFGTQPLANALENQRRSILNEFESALKNESYEKSFIQNKSDKFELPELSFDGIPTTLDEMTQSQLRMFIPIILKYSTGRAKPGWGKEECRPIWWPDDLPYANVRIDPRNEDAKSKQPWTEMLKMAIRNCYKHHNREDLLCTSLNTNNSKLLMNALKRRHDSRDDKSSKKDEYSNLIDLSGSPILMNNETENAQNEEDQYHNLWINLKNIRQDTSQKDNQKQEHILLESSASDDEIYQIIK